jgi:CheY-like chemotaxis protein
MEMVAQAGNAEQAIAEFQLALMDLSLPGTNGTDTLIAIRAEFPNAQIIMLTMSEGDGDAGAGRIVADSRWPSNKQIADDLGIAETTANFYIKNLRSGPSPTSSTMRQGAGRNSVSQAHLLQPAPEGRPLRRPGAAEVPQRRDSRGLQIVDNHGLFRRRRGSPARRCETTRGEVGC